MSTENSKQLVKQKKQDISTRVLAKVNEFEQTGELRIPKNYSVENSLKSAYLILSETKDKNKKPVLESCSVTSLSEALLKMVVWGLNPMKKQCYFVPYGGKIECIPDYTGKIAMAKRYAGLKDIKAHAVFKDDTFEFEVDPSTGRKKVTKHTQTLESMGSNEFKGAYAIMEMNDGTFDVEIMSKPQIVAAWQQGHANGTSPAHKKFPDRMARKSVINRACDALIRSSDDSVLYEDEDERKIIDVPSEDLNHEVKTKANKRKFDTSDIEDAEYEEEEEFPTNEADNEDNENERLYEEAMAEEAGQSSMANSPGFGA